MKTKFCPDCDEERPISEFGKRYDRRDGLKPYCRKHINLRQKKYRKDNPEFAEKDRLNSREWAKNNPEKHNENTKNWASKNREYCRKNFQSQLQKRRIR